MSGIHLDPTIETSAPVGITGADEEHVADVIEDLDLKKKLYVKATVTDGDVTVSNKLRILESQTSQNISPGGYTTIYSLGVAAVCSGFMIQANTTNFNIRLTVDGDQIFDIDCSWLNSFTNWNNSSNPASWVSFNSSSNVFYFIPALPLKIATSIVIDAKSNQGNRSIDGYYIQVAEIN